MSEVVCAGVVVEAAVGHHVPDGDQHITTLPTPWVGWRQRRSEVKDVQRSPSRCESVGCGDAYHGAEGGCRDIVTGNYDAFAGFDRYFCNLNPRMWAENAPMNILLGASKL